MRLSMRVWLVCAASGCLPVEPTDTSEYEESSQDVEEDPDTERVVNTDRDTAYPIDADTDEDTATQSMRNLNGWLRFCVQPTNGNPAPDEPVFQVVGTVRPGTLEERPCPDDLVHQFVIDDAEGVSWQVAAEETPHPVADSTSVSLALIHLLDVGQEVQLSVEPRRGWSGYPWPDRNYVEQFSIRSRGQLIYAVSFKEIHEGCCGTWPLDTPTPEWFSSRDADLLTFETSCLTWSSPGAAVSNVFFACDMVFPAHQVTLRTSDRVDHDGQKSLITLARYSSSSVYSTGCGGGNAEDVLFWSYLADALPAVIQPSD